MIEDSLSLHCDLAGGDFALKKFVSSWTARKSDEGKGIANAEALGQAARGEKWVGHLADVLMYLSLHGHLAAAGYIIAECRFGFDRFFSHGIDLLRRWCEGRDRG